MFLTARRGNTVSYASGPHSLTGLCVARGWPMAEADDPGSSAAARLENLQGWEFFSGNLRKSSWKLFQFII